ncbi:MAG: low temperature requirement protein A [Paraglaciecola sp.]|nr:low temperature requirement protein A [Paraglaciecola sp.]
MLFGKAVLSLANTLVSLSWSPTGINMAISKFVLTCGLWWLYFENIERRIAGKYMGQTLGA